MPSCLICGKEGKPVAVVCEDCLNRARNYSLLEAQCAVMREAIEDILHGNYTTSKELYEICKQALSTNTGRWMLDAYKCLNREHSRLSEYLMENFPSEIGKGNPDDGESPIDIAIRLLERLKNVATAYLNVKNSLDNRLKVLIDFIAALADLDGDSHDPD